MSFQKRTKPVEVTGTLCWLRRDCPNLTSNNSLSAAPVGSAELPLQSLSLQVEVASRFSTACEIGHGPKLGRNYLFNLLILDVTRYWINASYVTQLIILIICRWAPSRWQSPQTQCSEITVSISESLVLKKVYQGYNRASRIINL